MTREFELERWMMQCQRISTKSQLNQLCQSISRTLHMDYYLMCVFTPTQLQQSELFMLDNYPKDWLDYYFEKQLKYQDPAVLHSLSSLTPLFWQHANMVAHLNPKANAGIMNQAADSGLMDGITIPIRGLHGEFGLFSLACSRMIEMDEQLQLSSLMLALTPYFYETVHRIKQQLPQVDTVHLTKREQQCMMWIADGKTAWETAQILGVSERTVNFHVNNVIDKLGAANRQQAVAKAILSGVLTPSL